MRRTVLPLVVLACCAVPCLLPAPAAATPSPLASVQIAFTMPATDTGLWLSSAADCLIFTGGWSVYSTRRFVGVSVQPRGLLDVGGRSGEAIVPGEGIHVDRIFGPRPKAIAATDVGLQLAGRRAYLTGTIRGSRSHSARRAPRRRLARVSGVTIAQKTTKGHLTVTVRGRATLLPPLAATFERLRCKGPRESGRPIRSGESLGPLVATIVPARATALAGSFAAAISITGDTTLPTVEPTGGARSGPGPFRFAWAAGTRVPATCAPDCAPSSGTVRLVGGFDVVAGAQRVSFTDLAIDAAGQRYTLSATVAGVRYTVASSDGPVLALSHEIRALLGATFGDAGISGGLYSPTFAATKLAPS